MSRFLTFCLLVIPFTQGLSVLTETAPSLTVLPTEREFEEEVYENVTKHAKQSVFVPHVTPDDNGEHGPLHVKVNSYIRDILELKAVDSHLYDWTLDLVLRQKWNDKRLAYDTTHHPDFKYITLNTPSGMKSIWKPDTFFSRSVKGDFHFVLAPNALIWVYPNGDVLYSCRVSVTLRCVQNATAVPEKPEEKEEGAEKASDIVCPMRIASYGYTTDHLVYEWDDETPHAVDVTDKLYIPHYTLDKVTTEASIGKTRIGSWSSLIANFHFSHH